VIVALSGMIKILAYDFDKEAIEIYVVDYQLTLQVITNFYLKGELLYLFVPG